MEFINYLIANIFFSPAVIFIIIFLSLILKINKRKRALKESSLDNNNENDILNQSLTQISGINNDINWTSITNIIKDSEYEYEENNIKQSSVRHYTRWKTTQINTQINEYVLLMVIPENVKNKFENHSIKSNFLGKIAKKAANFTLEIFVKTYFSSEQLKYFKPDEIENIPIVSHLNNKFRLFSNNKMLAQKMKDKLSFINLNHKYKIGILMNSNGFHITTPDYLSNETEIRAFAEFCSEIAKQFI